MDGTVKPGFNWTVPSPLTGLGKTTGVIAGLGVRVAVWVGTGVAVLVKAAVQVEVGVKEGVAVGLGVEVACATITVAPATGNPLNCTAWPLVPAAPVRLKL